MINKVILIGNLGKDPEIKNLESGTTVANFPLATNENYKDKSGEWQNATEWHRISCFGKIAERVEKFRKGQKVYLEGKIKTDKWQDKDGNDRYTTKIIVRKATSLEKVESLAASQGQVSQVEDEDDFPF